MLRVLRGLVVVLVAALLAAGGVVVAAEVRPPGPQAAPAPAATTPVAQPLTRTAPPTTLPSALQSAPPSPTPSVAPATASDVLTARLEALVALPDTQAGGTLAVSVIGGDGAVLYAREAATPLLPASTIKLVTAAAALTVLGPDFRYVTVVDATAPIGPDGTLAGDLVVVGSGDPALATATFGGVEPRRPRTPLEALADQLVAAGLRRVTGRLLGDGGIFAPQPQASGWLNDYLEGLDTTRSSGLTAEAGRRLFVEDGRLQAVAADDPAAEAAASLLVLLADRGVVIDGGHAAGSALGAPVRLAEVSSAPLAALLGHVVRWSDNHMADAIFRTVGVAAGDSTWAGSGQAVFDALLPLGLDWSGAVLADGSGLSRDNRLTTTFLVQLDAAMTASDTGTLWTALMAVAGESGTLRARLSDTAADGRLHGKTGSLRDVRSLVASAEGPDGRRYHLGVIANDLGPSERGAVRLLQDRLGLALVEALWGCSQPLPPAPVTPAGLLPLDPTAPPPATPPEPVDPAAACAA